LSFFICLSSFHSHLTLLSLVLPSLLLSYFSSFVFFPCYLSLLHSGKTTQIPQFCADYAFPLENAPTIQNNVISKNTNSDNENRPNETKFLYENFEKISDQFQKELKSDGKNLENKLGLDINVSIGCEEISNERTAPSVSTVQPTRIIAVTQPRRVAAVTVAQRVAAERSGM
jgi:hypothetical protein